MTKVQQHPIHMKRILFWLLFESWYFWTLLTSLEMEDIERSNTENGGFCKSPEKQATHWHKCRCSSRRKAIFMSSKAGVTRSCWEASIKYCHKSHQLRPPSTPPLKMPNSFSYVPSVADKRTGDVGNAYFLHDFPLTFTTKYFCLAFNWYHPFSRTHPGTHPFLSFLSFFFNLVFHSEF